MRNPERLLNSLRYEDAVAEANDDGYEFPSDTSEMLQQAIIAFAQLENQDDDLVDQADEEGEGDDDEVEDDTDFDGARLSDFV